MAWENVCLMLLEKKIKGAFTSQTARGPSDVGSHHRRENSRRAVFGSNVTGTGLRCEHLFSSPPSNGGLDPTCLSSTGQSTEPQALWFWRVLERHPRARSVGDNPGGWPHGSLIPADGVRPGVDTAAALAGPPGLTGSSPGCPHSHRQLARQPSLRPSITWVTLLSMETLPLVSVGTSSVTHPSLLPWSRGKIVTKNQPGCCSLGQSGPRSRTQGLLSGVWRAAEEVVRGPDAGQGAQAPVGVRPCWGPPSSLWQDTTLPGELGHFCNPFSLPDACCTS